MPRAVGSYPAHPFSGFSQMIRAPRLQMAASAPAIASGGSVS